MLHNIGLFEWLIILLLVLLIFGPDRVVDLGKNLGAAIRGFKDNLQDPPKENGTDA